MFLCIFVRDVSVVGITKKWSFVCYVFFCFDSLSGDLVPVINLLITIFYIYSSIWYVFAYWVLNLDSSCIYLFPSIYERSFCNRYLIYIFYIFVSIYNSLSLRTRQRAKTQTTSSTQSLYNTNSWTSRIMIFSWFMCIGHYTRTQGISASSLH